MNPSMGSRATFQHMKSAHKPGYVVIVVFASLSAFALSFIALRALWLVLSPIFKRNSNDQVVSKEQIFFRTQLGRYAVSLLASNVFISAAGVAVGAWIAMDGIPPDKEWLCIFQAILMQIGNFSTAYFTVAVACHTMNSLVFRGNQTVWVGATIIAMGWVSSIIIGLAPLKIYSPGSGLAYGFDGFSCGIKNSFPVHHFLLHLLPIFVAAVASVVIYSLIFLALRGTLVVKGGLRIVLDPEQRCILDRYHCFISNIAKSMLWYPFAYNILLLPHSITKLLELSGYPVAFAGNVFAYTCSFMLGLVNVCLLYNTFRVLEPAFGLRTDIRKTDTECFGGSLESITPCYIIIPKSSSQSPQKPTPARTYGESFLPSWHPSTDDNTASSWTRTPTCQKSISNLSTNSPVDYFISDGYEGHTGSSSPSLPATESTARLALPITDFKNILITVPDPILRRGDVDLPDTQLKQWHSSSAYYVRPPIGLPPPPRYKRSFVSRQSSLETLTPESFDKEQWRDVLTRRASVTNSISQERGSFEFPYLPSPSGWASQFAFLPIEQSSISDFHDAIGALASNATPAPTIPVAMSPSTNFDGNDYETLSAPSTTITASSRIRGLPKVPRNVDSNDFGSLLVLARRTSDTIKEEFYSSVGAITLGGLSPFAWATPVTDVETGDSPPRAASAHVREDWSKSISLPSGFR